MKKLSFTIAIILLFTSCGVIISKLYGINTLQKFDKKKCEKFVSSIDKKNIKFISYYADTNSYKCVRKMPISDKVKKDFSQPIQIIYFNNDSLVSFHANCYARGSVSNLNWNTDNRFNQFIPKSAVALDSAKFTIKDFSKCYPNQVIEKEKKTTVIIYWTLMLEKISKTAIETVISNIQNNNVENDVVIYLINNDQSFIEK